ncbi:MAG: 6-pyruvoyl-tetrahydropterin synthase-related protein [Candidatus Acidiferrales bacterium]
MNSELPPTSTSCEGSVDARPARRTALHLFLLGALVFLFCWPLLFHGLPELSDDSTIHVGWDKGFSNQLAAGEWYPRWLSEDNDGLGSPVFFYYAPIPSYASSAFRFLFGARDPDGWLESGYGCFLAVLLSAFGAYFWLRSHASGRAALFGAAIYVIAPYHLAVDLYVRGATAELWTFAWMPLILLSVEALACRARWAFPALAVGYALLVMTHLPTVLCFSPVVLGAGFFLAQRNRAIVTALETLAAMALGAGLAAIYLVPAMFDQWKINILHLVDSNFDFRYQWLFRPVAWGLDFPERMAILNATMFAFIGILLWLCLRHCIDRDTRRVAIFYAGVTVFAFVCMSQLSYLAWRMIPYLRFVQFPWRFSVLPPLAAAMLSALSFSYLTQRRARLVAASLVVLAAGWIGATVWVARPEISAAMGRANPLAAAARAEVKSRPGPCEYLPLSTALAGNCSDKSGVRVQMLRELLGGHAAKSAFFPAGSADQIGGAAAVLDWKPRKVLLDVSAPEAGPLTLRHFYYIGWSAHVASTGESIPIGPSKPDGFLQVTVPQGNHEIVVELPTQPTEKAGRLISLASLAGLALIAVYLKQRTSLADLSD